MRQHHTLVRGVPPTPPAGTPGPARPTGPARRSPRLAAVTTVAAFAAVLAVALSGCGIRDTAVPVDAGDPASRTACPPGPSASLTALERDASLIPTSAPTRLWPPMTKEEQASAAAAAAKSAAEAAAAAQATASPSLTPSAVASPPAPTATTSDGTLACLHPSASG
ncbi:MULTISPECIES: hypothetical protein [Streptacidiphilus]|uniref:Uncharacterized protein n=2 Tax=Streptacidiphilus TaxID=228398 RepID=A0ABV6US90_9ACTN|nr:hypothetical protein [Streptacidiphilus jeojiense]